MRGNILAAIGSWRGTVVAAALAAAVIVAVAAAPRAQSPTTPSAGQAVASNEPGVLADRVDAARRMATDPTQPSLAVRAALTALAEALTALGPTAPAAQVALPVALRADLARAGAALTGILATTPREADVAALASARARDGVDDAAIAALVARIRAANAAASSLALTFEGSFSQTRSTKDAVAGGHASAMGPAPAMPSTPSTGSLLSSAVFEERPTLPTRTWAGGPTKDHILESAGNGVALFDYDNDGWLDIYLVTAPQLTASRERLPRRNALYRNRGHWQFEDVSAHAGVDAAVWGSGACVGDVDGDGALDLYVTAWGGNLLYRNRGDGTFDEIAARAGVSAGGWSTGCTFLDADADGDLDLYVARYVSTTLSDLMTAERTLQWRDGPRIMVGPAGLPGERDLYFENDGHGQFREVAAERGLDDAAGGYGFGVVATDVDADGHVDLFVANDSTPNFLYHNRGDGRFESVGLIAGVAVNAEARAQAGMGADAGDLDGDGRLDLVLTAFAHDRNTVYRNLGSGLFEDASVQTGLAAATFARMGWGVTTFDADLDGDLDLFVANGHIFADVGDFPALGETFAQANQLFLNDAGMLHDVSASAGPGLAVARVSRGLAAGDLDNDGDLDLVVSNIDDTPTLLENTQRTGHHWIAVRLSSPAGNRFAIGARVTFEDGQRRQVREVRSGGSYLSQGDLRVFVGLGSTAGPVAVEVTVPGGARWRWTGLAADRLHDLVLTPPALPAGSGRR